MSNINNLTSKIISEAEGKKNDILKIAHEEEAKIVDKRAAEARVIEEDILNRAKREAETMKERIISGAQHSVRNKKLSAKQQVIERVFERAVETLNNLSEDQYLGFVRNSVLSMELKGEYNLILNEKALNLVTQNFVNELNRDLLSHRKEFQLVFTNNPGNFRSGFILERNGIEINNTFDTLLNSLREDLEYEVARVLFS
jgi:V/A-type H+/Na+-transporting ATPase subunit E